MNQMPSATVPQRAAAPVVADRELDVLQLGSALWRAKFIVAAIVAISIAIGWFYAFRVAKTYYYASATVMLENRAEQVTNLTSVLSGISADQASINTEVEVIKSRELVERLVEELGLIDDPEFNGFLAEPDFYSRAGLKNAIFGAPPRDELPPRQRMLDLTVDSVRSALFVQNIRQSYLFEIGATTRSPQKSAAIANKLAELYTLSQLEAKIAATDTATNWLADRVATLRIELEEAETAVKELDSNADLVNPEAIAAIGLRLNELRDRKDSLSVRLEAARSEAERYDAAVRTGDVDRILDVANDALLDRIAARRASNRFDQETFDARVELLRKQKQAEVERAAQQLASAAEAIEEIEAELDARSNDLVKLQQLRREAEASRLIYEHFLGRLKETSVQKGIQQSDSRIISRAIVPTSTVAPKRTRILILSAFTGVILAIIVVLGLELYSNGFRNADDLESFTGRQVMGVIPYLKARSRRQLIEKIADNPMSAINEAARNLRTSIVASHPDRPPQIIVSTSSMPGEGKTTLAFLLSRSFAMLGKRVLLVEADIRRLVFGQYFEVDAGPGLVSAITGDVSFDEVVRHIDSLDIDIVSSEKVEANPADLFSSDKFRAFLETLKTRYDHIIIDTPPVLVVPDARVVGQHADVLVYSVQWNKTRREQVRQGLQLFEGIGVRVSTLVLSQVNTRKQKGYGYQDYGTYKSHYYQG